MRLHGDRRGGKEVFRKDGSKALNTGGDNEVWSFGDEAYDILVKYLELRETLRDYTRGLMKEAHEKGAPIMRPLFYEFQNFSIWGINLDFALPGDITVTNYTRKLFLR